MRRWSRLLCTAGFALICVAVVALLSRFMNPQSPYLAFEWDAVFFEAEDGERAPLAQDAMGLLEDGGRYAFVAHVEGLPEQSDLRVSTDGLRGSVRIDGELPASFDVPTQEGEQSSRRGMILVPFPEGADAFDVELTIEVLDADNAVYPYFCRVSSDQLETAFDIAADGLNAIPAGACALAFLLICGVFLFDLSRGRLNFSLLLAAGAALIAMAHALARLGSVYLTPQPMRVLSDIRTEWVVSALLVAYLLCNYKRGHLRLMGIIVLWTCAALAALWGASAVFPGLRAALEGLNARYDRSILLFLLSVYLVLCCAGIAVYRLVATFLQLQADKQALEAKSRLAMQGYTALREQSEWTALMRHEWKNRLMALQLLCKKGDFAALGESLAALTGELEHGVAPRFTENESVDLILQDTAAKAKKLGVEFHASVSLPEQLDISEQDLCALLMNLFDNALRAAGSVRPPKRREINLRMQYRQGFWAIHCDNTYDPQLEEPRGEGHGIGLKQMRMVAEKYHGMLSIDRGEMRFTVELALKV